MGKALGNGRRAERVDVLAQGERSVEELAGEIGQSVANTSQHLQFMLRAGLVRRRRDGPRVFYPPGRRRRRRAVAAIGQVAGQHVTRIDELAAVRTWPPPRRYADDRRLPVAPRAPPGGTTGDGTITPPVGFRKSVPGLWPAPLGVSLAAG